MPHLTFHHLTTSRSSSYNLPLSIDIDIITYTYTYIPSSSRPSLLNGNFTSIIYDSPTIDSSLRHLSYTHNYNLFGLYLQTTV